ncbi:hypothetical protein F4V91_00535 [Neorhizobium galegae]|uniref:Uncharacterized protein n=1 Tax=Neorhizobium galegae TaxID=399 RepID=A0A6A1TMV1_NEOGA|nr:hypothetical protein [Neorhizobium galegae]KAB1085054.1 hypothetical protein F4V91_00535 [Neorhizobium galegae]
MSHIYTFQDLQTRTLSQLHMLRGALQRDLSLAAPYSADARQTLASLDVVNRMIRMRSPSGPKL